MSIELWFDVFHLSGFLALPKNYSILLHFKKQSKTEVLLCCGNI